MSEATQISPPELNPIRAARGCKDLVWVGVVAVLWLLFYRVDILTLIAQWQGDSGWSHGFAIPVVSLWMVWLKWDVLKKLPVNGSWVGLPVLLLGALVHILFLTFAQHMGLFHVSQLSMPVTLLGLVLFLLGWDFLRILWLPICFLPFMIVPPHVFYAQMTTPLQNLSAITASNLLPLVGIGSVHSSTQILIETANGKMESLNVAEACSGMRLLLAFVALSVAMAYTSDRPMWQKVIVVLMAVPVAIICNVLRVFIIALLFVWVDPKYARGSTHENIGLLMLPVAALLLWGVSWILNQLFIEEPVAEVKPR
ncbi:MAG: exosortase/archaeosortase family protein [Phycisphaerae bacterium]